MINVALFMAKVVQSPGCWGWTAAHKNGYGVFAVGRKSRRAHRVSWEIANGPIPAGLLACHRCDNRGCVNPAHLFLGTHSDNARDMADKGRWELPGRPRTIHRGMAHGMARLDDARVRRIREFHRIGLTGLEIAAQFGISNSSVSYIVRREQWAHVEAA